jgi:hypothetical protein
MMLQEDLEAIDKWCRQNNFGLNIGKCAVVSFSRKADGNTNVARHSIRKDLGVWFDSKLSFHDHVHRVISQAWISSAQQ